MGKAGTCTNAYAHSPHANTELQRTSARARTVPLKPKIRPLQTWPSEQSASLEASPAHGFSTARGQKGADGSGSVLCQESLCAAWPSSNPPATEEGGKRQLEEGSFKTPTQSYSQAKSPSAFKNCLKNESTWGGIPVRAVSLLQPPHKTRCTEVKKSCRAELRLRG